MFELVPLVNILPEFRFNEGTIKTESAGVSQVNEGQPQAAAPAKAERRLGLASYTDWSLAS